MAMPLAGFAARRAFATAQFATAFTAARWASRTVRAFRPDRRSDAFQAIRSCRVSAARSSDPTASSSIVRTPLQRFTVEGASLASAAYSSKTGRHGQEADRAASAAGGCLLPADTGVMQIASPVPLPFPEASSFERAADTFAGAAVAARAASPDLIRAQRSSTSAAVRRYRTRATPGSFVSSVFRSSVLPRRNRRSFGTRRRNQYMPVLG